MFYVICTQIIAVGPNVPPEYSVRRRICVENHFYCGHCYQCTHGSNPITNLYHNITRIFTWKFFLASFTPSLVGEFWSCVNDYIEPIGNFGEILFRWIFMECKSRLAGENFLSSECFQLYSKLKLCSLFVQIWSIFVRIWTSLVMVKVPNMVDSLSTRSSPPSMPTYSRQILMTLGLLYWSVSWEQELKLNLAAYAHCFVCM